MPKLHQGRRYDLWWKNPYKYHKQLKDRGESQVLWDFSFLRKYRIDVLTFMRQNFHGLPWKAYILDERTCYLIDYTCGTNEHRGSWPVWSYPNYNLRELEDLIRTPWDQRPVNPNAAWYDIPVVGQKHRVFIKDIKNGAMDPILRKRRQKLTKIQRAFPEVELFIKPIDFSFPLMFGAGFSAGCMDPYKAHHDNKGSIVLPNGSHIMLKRDIDRLYREAPKIEFLGYDVDHILEDPWINLEFQIASCRHAAHHWDDPTGPFIGARAQISHRVDYENPDMYAKTSSYSVVKFKKDKIKETDKILCDSCSLWRLCPAYRAEEVCGLPGTESKKLSEMFKSRNADEVVEGLASIVSKQAERVERRMDEEQFAPGGSDKEIDKQLNALFKNGTQLAKLRNPNLGRPLVQINNGPGTQNNQIVANADPRALAATVIQEIEATGVRREDITDEMIAEHIGGARQAIEAEVVNVEEDE